MQHATRAMDTVFSHGYALLIGVGDALYASWPLPVTVRDMQALQAVLTDPGLCGYPADRIRLLHDASATKQPVRSGLHCAPWAHRWLGTLAEGGAVRVSGGSTAKSRWTR